VESYSEEEPEMLPQDFQGCQYTAAAALHCNNLNAFKCLNLRNAFRLVDFHSLCMSGSDIDVLGSKPNDLFSGKMYLPVLLGAIDERRRNYIIPATSG
jgi:hypothetical protein